MSDIDPRDHVFIVGAPTLTTTLLSRRMLDAGTSADWEQRAGTISYVEAVARTLSGDSLARGSMECYGISLTQLKAEGVRPELQCA